MQPLWAPFFIYALVTTFTPGPNNITSSAIGMRRGYWGTLPYIGGITVGFLVIMLASGFLTDVASRAYRGILPWFKWIGVAYMAWLAVSLFLPSRHGAEEEAARPVGFTSGLLLQIMNPKVILYGLTIYSSFHALISDTPIKLVGSSVLLAVLGCISTSLWALLGSLFSRLLRGRVASLCFNVVMAALLVLSAVSLALH
jgi:cysteine/O-acetylserine efflux protein